MRRIGLAVLLALGLFLVPLPLDAQRPAMPIIGYLSQRSPTDSASIVAAFRQGLKEEGFVEGQNVAIEFRYAEGQIDRVPALANDLVRRNVTVFVATGGTGSVVKAKQLIPRTIPIVFAMGGDPVKLGVVASFARPGDNITGVCFLLSELAAKQVELLHELVRNAAVIGFLVNPKDPTSEAATRDAQAAAAALGHKLVIVNASTASEIDPAVAALAQRKIAAVFVNADPFVAMHDIPAGSELTIDYAMIDGDPAERRLLRAAIGFSGCSMLSYNRAVWALRSYLDSWDGIDRVGVGMPRQGYDLQLTQYDERGWRATFYTTGIEHSPTSAIRSSWGRTPCHTVICVGS